jgi:hypothetical protein
MVSQEVGYDAGKQIKERKRFMTVDTLGFIGIDSAGASHRRQCARTIWRQTSTQARPRNGISGCSPDDYLD